MDQPGSSPNYFLGILSRTAPGIRIGSLPGKFHRKFLLRFVQKLLREFEPSDGILSETPLNRNRIEIAWK